MNDIVIEIKLLSRFDLGIFVTLSTRRLMLLVHPIQPPTAVRIRFPES